jgi:muramoyltetrapeptide carboxypeptidase
MPGLANFRERVEGASPCAATNFFKSPYCSQSAKSLILKAAIFSEAHVTFNLLAAGAKIPQRFLVKPTINKLCSYMNRKRFLNALSLLTTAFALPTREAAAAGSNFFKTPCRIPPYLNPGAVIGITSPAGYITFEELQPAVQVLQSWGYTIRLGATIGKRDFTFGGTDDERRADLQQMLDDPSINAIMCARGGYGSVRIVDGLDWSGFKKAPKWVIGFSDISVLHQHIHAQCHVASIHSKMTNSFPDDWTKADPIQVQTINSIHEALAGKKLEYRVAPHNCNKPGVAEGVLIGGNLKTMESLAGTTSDIDTDGKILFVEDTGEYLYSIDRMFWNLARTGKLKALAGLVVGGFKVKPDDAGEEFGKMVPDIVLQKIKAYHYPVVFDFPVGHQRANYALKCGVRHRLTITNEAANLTEIV